MSNTFNFSKQAQMIYKIVFFPPNSNRFQHEHLDSSRVPRAPVNIAQVSVFPFICVLNRLSKAVCLNVPRCWMLMGRVCSVQLPWERRGAAARERRPSAGAHRLPVAPAGAGHDRDGELQPGRSKGARLLVRRGGPEEEGNTHPARGLRQDPARVGRRFSL